MSLRFEEEEHGIFVRTVEWRELEDFPGIEIDKDGRIRRISTRRHYNTIAGGGESLRIMENGVRRQESVRRLRNKTFPELPSW